MRTAQLKTLCTFAAFAVLLSACSGKPDSSAAASPAANASAPAAPIAPAGPPISITTIRAQQRDLPLLLKATGTVAPLSSVDVRAQVTSVIKRVHFREGQFVRAGDLLFTLDARTDEANVAKARAQLARDQASLADAQRQLERSKQLLAQNFISQGAVDTNQALVDSQMALVASDRAAIDASRVPLSYSRVTAPSAGRAGAVTVFAGSSVQANTTTLVTITQLEPIAVAFNIPQRHLADALAALQGSGAAVTATLPEGGEAAAGRLRFVDNAVDANSGTVKVKAVFDNRNGKLWPGAFVDISLTVRTLKEAVVVPQAAIVQSARGAVIYTVEDGKAALRPVQILYAQGEDAAVSGLRAGEAVVLDGRQSLRPGALVAERPRESTERTREPTNARDAASAPGKGASQPAAGGAANQGLATKP
jgi:RND family efflux transporter MFP subunit